MSLIDQLANALDRALRYRRQLALDAGRPPGNLDELITGDAFTPESLRPARQPSWVVAGRVFDGTVGAMLEVYWQPETDRVQIERPPQWVAPPPPAMVIEPLARTPYGPPGWHTHPAFIYSRDGQDYDAAEAEALINAAGSTEGWTWRLRDGEASAPCPLPQPVCDNPGSSIGAPQ